MKTTPLIALALLAWVAGPLTAQTPAQTAPAEEKTVVVSQPGDAAAQTPASNDLGKVLMQIAAAPVVVAEGGLNAAAAATEQVGSWFDRDILTGRRFVSREMLSPKGITLGLDSTTIYQQNIHGGLSTHRHKGRWAGSYDLELAGDLDKLLHIPDAGFYVAAEGSYRDGISEPAVGDYFGVNGDAAGNRTLDIAECWYQQGFFAGKLRVRLGKVDLSSGFDFNGAPVGFDGSLYANDETTQFLNASLGGNPTIPFPDSGLGVMVMAQPAETWYVAAGAADAQAVVSQTGFHTAFHEEDYFVTMAETGLATKFDSARGPLAGTYRVGLWYDPQDKARFTNGTTRRDDTGVYLSFDQAVYRESDKADDTQGLGLFARWGWADQSVNEVTNFWSLGLQYQGLLPSRDEDVTGLALAQGLFTHADNAGFTEDGETVTEWYYNARLYARESFELNLTPSLQWINHPGGDAANRDALVMALRLQMVF